MEVRAVDGLFANRPVTFTRNSVIQRLGLVAVLASTTAVCDTGPHDFSGFPCNDDGACVKDWVCDQSTNTCVRCEDDVDNDGIAYCSDNCVDVDGDGLGTGNLDNAGCVDATVDSDDSDTSLCADKDLDSCDDCAVGTWDPANDGTDTDVDGICDLTDDCTDADGDGLGNGNLGNAACAPTTTDCDDSSDLCTTICEDLDGDTIFDCKDECIDGDGDGHGIDGGAGTCTGTDCDDSSDLCSTTCEDADNDTIFDCKDECIDGDGDGYGIDGGAGTCTGTDCDDMLPTCVGDCDTNSDVGCETVAVADCIEEYCGSDPTDCAPPAGSGSDCVIVTSEAELEAAILAANLSADYQDHLLLRGSFSLTHEFEPAWAISGSEGVTIRQAAGSVLQIDAPRNRAAFKIEGDNSIIEGLTFFHVKDGQSVIEIKDGNDNTIRDCTLIGFEKRGVYIDGGAGNVVFDNVIQGGTDSAGTNETGGVVVRSASQTRVVGNVIAQNASDGIQVRQSTETFIDHNTVADNTGGGVRFYHDPSTDTCMRNNNITGNVGASIIFAETTTWHETPAGICVSPLSTDGPGDPLYGNNAEGNGLLCDDVCVGTDLATCAACLPASAASFWQHAMAPAYTGPPQTVGDPEFYCLGAADLINSAEDLGVYDLNGDDPDRYTGSGPDIGGRESGSAGCP
ncbi:right-handed parallel beta-helix repeat-containing protein [Myxococcota bacterium]